MLQHGRGMCQTGARYLAIGLEAMDETATIAGIEARTPTGWPLAAIKYSVPPNVERNI
jgi:hypothetical protein